MGAHTQSPQQAPADLKDHFHGQRRTFFVHWHATAGGWRFREIWRSFLQEYVPDLSLPQRGKKVKEGPLSGLLVLFSPLGTKVLAAIRVVVGSKPSMKALGLKWMQPAKATSSLWLSNFCRFSSASAGCSITILPCSTLVSFGEGRHCGEKAPYSSWENNVPTLHIDIKNPSLCTYANKWAQQQGERGQFLTWPLCSKYKEMYLLP